MENLQPSDRWDNLLGKYVSVWIWSILLGMTLSTTISFTSVRSGGTRGLVGMVLAFPVLIGVLATFVGFTHLLRYLYRHILPVFMFGESPNGRETAYHLHVALRYLIYAVMLRLATTALEILINTVAGF
jgi:hypothetical protein